MARELTPYTRSLVRSRIPNYDDLDQVGQLTAAIKVIAADFDIYRERNLVIKDKLTNQMVPFELNWEQEQLKKMVIEKLVTGRPVRFIILKARQMGISTLIEALCFWWTSTHRWVVSNIIAHKADAAENLYEMFRNYYEQAHTMFQPTLKYNTRKDLVFDVEDKVKAELRAHIDACEDEELCGVSHKPAGLASKIKTLVAKDGVGRSSTITFFHGSEVAFWEAKADVVSSAVQAVPMAANTFVFLESTANGVGGYFYDEWQSAMAGESNLTPVFFAWHSHDEYEWPVQTPILQYDDEEGRLIEVFKERMYPEDSWDRKIAWRREKKKEFRYEPKKFYQEYPADDMEAFLASGNPVFDLDTLRAMDLRARKFNKEHGGPMFGHIVPDSSNIGMKKYVFEEVPMLLEDHDPSPLKVWELPEQGEKYVIGVDVSEGKLEQTKSGKENDYSVIDVTRSSDLKTVARWRGHIDPDLLGGVAYAIGTFYNTALIAVEVNNHGLTTVQSLRNKFYRNLYMREQNEELQFQERTALMGWQTNRKTKKLVINNLVHAIRDGDILDLDTVFIRECMTYIKDDQGFTNAQEGCFDDTVMAKAIALKMTDFDEMDSEELKSNIQKPQRRNTHASNSNSSLESIAAGRTRSSSPRDAVARRRAARAAHKANRRAR